MAWFPRPPYPNDVLAGYLFHVVGGLNLFDSTGGGAAEPRTFEWQIDQGTAYELMFGPFSYHGSTAGCILRTEFNLTDGGDYDFTLANNFICGSNSIYMPMLSRLFAVGVAGTTLTATFSVFRHKGAGVQVDYASPDDPTLFAVRAVGKLDDTFVDASGVYQTNGIITTIGQ